MLGDDERIKAAITRLENLANERPGLGTAVRAITEFGAIEEWDYEGTEFNTKGIFDGLARVIDVLIASAFPASDGKDQRLHSLLVRMVSFEVGEKGDLSEMVDCQNIAREILDDWEK